MGAIARASSLFSKLRVRNESNRHYKREIISLLEKVGLLRCKIQRNFHEKFWPTLEKTTEEQLTTFHFLAAISTIKKNPLIKNSSEQAEITVRNSNKLESLLSAEIHQAALIKEWRVKKKENIKKWKEEKNWNISSFMPASLFLSLSK